MNIWKAIGAIIAGVIFILITHSGMDFILEGLGIFTPPTVRFDTTWMLVTALVYRSLFTIGGGYVTAMLAPEPKTRFVILLGLLLTFLSVAGAIMVRVMDLSPLWFPIALVILGFPCVWLGGKLRTRSQ